MLLPRASEVTRSVPASPTEVYADGSLITTGVDHSPAALRTAPTTARFPEGATSSSHSATIRPSLRALTRHARLDAGVAASCVGADQVPPGVRVRSTRCAPEGARP